MTEGNANHPKVLDEGINLGEAHRAGWVVAAVVLLAAGCAVGATTGVGRQTRPYYIAADEVAWNYAPAGLNMVTGQALLDTYSGLMGPMKITARGKARPDGSPDDVDRDISALFAVMNETSRTTWKPSGPS